MMCLCLTRTYVYSRLVALMLQMLILMTLGVSSKADVVEASHASVLFREEGSMEISGKYYYAIIDIDVQGLLESVAPIGKSLETIRLGLQQELELLTSMSPRRTNKALDPPSEGSSVVSNINPIFTLERILTSSMRDHLTFLVQDLEGRHNSLIDFLQALEDFQPVTKQK